MSTWPPWTSVVKSRGSHMAPSRRAYGSTPLRRVARGVMGAYNMAMNTQRGGVSHDN